MAKSKKGKIYMPLYVESYIGSIVLPRKTREGIANRLERSAAHIEELIFADITILQNRPAIVAEDRCNRAHILRREYEKVDYSTLSRNSYYLNSGLVAISASVLAAIGTYLIFGKEGAGIELTSTALLFGEGLRRTQRSFYWGQQQARSLD